MNRDERQRLIRRAIDIDESPLAAEETMMLGGELMMALIWAEKAWAWMREVSELFDAMEEPMGRAFDANPMDKANDWAGLMGRMERLEILQPNGEWLEE